MTPKAELTKLKVQAQLAGLTGYVLWNQGWRYNDEYYERDGDDDQLEGIYFDAAIAEQEAERLNTAERDTDVYDYNGSVIEPYVVATVPFK